jgi:hypothetical protein
VLLSLFGFEIKRYLRGFLLLAIATAVFSLVNLAVSTLPDTISIGGDISQLCGVNATSTSTPAPTPTPSNITNINFYDPFNALDAVYWRNLTHPWVVTGGHVRTSVSDASYNNAIYYIVDFIEPEHDTVKINTRVKIDASPDYNEVRYYCVFLASNDLSTRVLGCIETYNYANYYYYVYGSIRIYRSGSVTLLSRVTIASSSSSTIIPGIRDLSLTVTKLNETHVSISLTYISPVTTDVVWSDLGYFGFYMSYAYGSEGFDYIDAWITSVNATSTVYYNVNFPPPLPSTTVTVTVTETRILELGKDVLVIPLGSFIRVLSFAVYVVYITRTVKHFVPEF